MTTKTPSTSPSATDPQAAAVDPEPIIRLASGSIRALSTPAPIIRGSEDGEQRWFHGGCVHTWKAKAEETGGAFFLFEEHMVRGQATPLHTHPDSDETMYVLEGEIVMNMGGEDHTIAAGGLFVAPRGVPYAFMVTSESATLLCLHTPGACQAFYMDASEPITAEQPASGVADFDRVMASAQKNGGIEFLGPSPFAQP
jgi:quercetin dioxygenase-like cupin family protein